MIWPLITLQRAGGVSTSATTEQELTTPSELQTGSLSDKGYQNAWASHGNHPVNNM